MRAALLASALVLFATACDLASEPDDGGCPNGTATGLSISIGGAPVMADLGACAHTNGASIVVWTDGWEINVGGATGIAGTFACDYEGGVVASLTRLDGSGDRWEASPGNGDLGNCTLNVDDATADGVPITGSFAGQLARGTNEGGIENASVSFSFHIPPIE